MKWKTDEIEKVLKTIPGLKLKRGRQGGDYDTTHIEVDRVGATCGVFGMKETGGGPSCTTPDDSEVDYLFACYSDKSGMVNADTKSRRLALDIREVLEGAGYKVSDGGWETIC